MKHDPKIASEAQQQINKKYEAYKALMAPLFAQAEQKGLWFWTPYQSLWFTPSELRKEHDSGSLRWGPDNWKLRDPMELVSALKSRRKDLKKELKLVLERIENEKEKDDQTKEN